MVAPSFRFPPAVGFRKLGSNAELLLGSRWWCGSWSLFSGLSLEAGLLGVVNVRGRRAPTDPELQPPGTAGEAGRPGDGRSGRGVMAGGRWTWNGRGREL